MLPVRFVVVAQLRLMQDPLLAVLHVDAGLRLARPSHELDADPVGPERVRAHVVHLLLE